MFGNSAHVAPVTGQKLLEETIRFIAEIRKNDSSLMAVVGGVGVVPSLLWSKATSESITGNRELSSKLGEIADTALRQIYRGEEAIVHVYVFPSMERDKRSLNARVLISEILWDPKSHEEIVEGEYPKHSSDLSIQFVVSLKKYWTPATQLHLPKDQHSIVKAQIVVADPAILFVSALHFVSAGMEVSGPQAIDATQEWSSLVLFARIVKAFHKQPLPSAFTISKFTSELRHHVSSKSAYHELGDWVRQQALDGTNDEIVRETCQVLARYFEPPYPSIPHDLPLGPPYPDFPLSSPFVAVSRVSQAERDLERGTEATRIPLHRH